MTASDGDIAPLDPQSPDAPDLSEFHAIDEVTELRRQNGELQGKLRKLRGEREDLVEAVKTGARDAIVALGPVPKIAAPKLSKKGSGKPETALWHLTDWQGSKVTTSYNSEVMRERIMRFCDKAARLTEIQRADHPVTDCVILLGGDMVEGLFNFPSQPFEVDASIFGQFTSVARLEADVVRRALALYENVLVVQEWGNHGRMGSKRAVLPRSDNIDRMCAELGRAILSDPQTDELHPRLEWRVSEEDIHHFEIGNYAALLIHGDEIGRNGYASPNTVLNHIKGWKAGAYPKPFRDVYSGHVHRHDEYSIVGGGSFYISGSPESDNRYARDTMAASSIPSQRLHFVEPEKGSVTAQYKVPLT